ncbi:NAD(P)-dependent oxidoreductase, partial [Bacteroidia bacterium]|nr:NAD(P)-dependent oxidoreductase [Bacteroidia bacterium]
MKTILITGASGFIGNHLLKEIKNNYSKDFRIVLLTSKEIQGYDCILHDDYKFTKNDFLNNNVKEVYAIIHLGAFIPKSGSDANLVEQSTSNINNLIYLLKNIPNTPKVFIYLSTVDVYGKVNEIISESALTTPQTLYGWSKLYGEKILEHWAKQNDITIQILRIGHIYGSGEESYKKIIPITIKKIKRGESPEIYSDGSELRSFLHVNDCVKAIINAIKLETYVGPINVVANKGYSILEIVVTIKSIINPEISIVVRNEISKK